MAPRIPAILNFAQQRPRPPRQRIYIDLDSGLRLLLDLPGVVRLTHGGIPAGPCRLSVYRPVAADHILAAARVCSDPEELARDGLDLDFVVELVDGPR